MKILVGLGNPGEKYKNSRHNIGFSFLDFLSQDWTYNKKFNADISKKDDLVLIKPLSFMNNSGLCLRAFFDYYNLLPKKLKLFTSKDSDLNDILTVVHDDLDIDFSKYKVSTNASSAGHNGVASIIQHLKTKNFKRIRIGINNEFKKNTSGENFVLQNFSKEEKSEIEDIFERVKEAILAK